MTIPTAFDDILGNGRHSGRPVVRSSGDPPFQVPVRYFEGSSFRGPHPHSHNAPQTCKEDTAILIPLSSTPSVSI